MLDGSRELGEDSSAALERIDRCESLPPELFSPIRPTWEPSAGVSHPAASAGLVGSCLRMLRSHDDS